MPFRTTILALAVAGLAVPALAQTTSPAATASSNGKDASAVITTPPQDPTLGSGQTAGARKAKPMKNRHHRSTTSGGGSSMSSPGGPGSPPPTLPNSTGATGGTSPGA